MSMRTYQHNKRAHRNRRRLARAEALAMRHGNDNNLIAHAA